MIRLALAALAATILFASAAEARRHHAGSPGWRHVTHFCGDRPCGFFGDAPGFRTVSRTRSRGNLRKISARPRAALRQPAQDRAKAVRTDYRPRIVSHPPGCPSYAFCGCGVSIHVFGRSIRDLWLASNWFRFPKADPAPGMIAVRRGHVFAILKVIRRGLVLAYDPNSGGHRTRIHARSLAGFSVRNPRAAGKLALR